jgi:tRNA G18 (ribose-2'-O)-methylase SpoU
LVTALLDDYALAADPVRLERAGLFVAEGRLVVERLLEGGRYDVHSVLVTPAAAAAMADVLARRPDVTVLVRDPSVLEATTGIDFHRGCLALARRPIDAVTLPELRGRRLLAIEGVGNPDNIGGLFRTAFALGVDFVVLDAGAGDPLYRKAIRTSMGATLRLPCRRVEGWAATLVRVREIGFRILALTPHPDATPLGEVAVDRRDRVVVLVGAEGSGLAPATLSAGVERVRIDIDPRADSLNVVVAAAIALHALNSR